MKKVIEIDEGLQKKIENVREKFHIKTQTNVINMALSCGLEYLENVYPFEPCAIGTQNPFLYVVTGAK